jgi:hypothetical protein
VPQGANKSAERGAGRAFQTRRASQAHAGLGLRSVLSQACSPCQIHRHDIKVTLLLHFFDNSDGQFKTTVIGGNTC